MLISEFLGYAARSIESGIPIQRGLAPRGWADYIALTLPQSCDEPSTQEIVDSRSLRFMLAAAIAKADEIDAEVEGRALMFSRASDPKSWNVA